MAALKCEGYSVGPIGSGSGCHLLKQEYTMKILAALVVHIGMVLIGTIVCLVILGLIKLGEGLLSSAASSWSGIGWVVYGPGVIALLIVTLWLAPSGFDWNSQYGPRTYESRNRDFVYGGYLLIWFLILVQDWAHIITTLSGILSLPLFYWTGKAVSRLLDRRGAPVTIFLSRFSGPLTNPIGDSIFGEWERLRDIRHTRRRF
jgi:hypothetical protein